MLTKDKEVQAKRYHQGPNVFTTKPY